MEGGWEETSRENAQVFHKAWGLYGIAMSVIGKWLLDPVR